MSTFKTDRDLILGLTDKDAHEVLAVLDYGETDQGRSSSFRAALEAANRSPDVSRYFLVEKAQNHVASSSAEDVLAAAPEVNATRATSGAAKCDDRVRTPVSSD
jgi:hypothetical protein